MFSLFFLSLKGEVDYALAIRSKGVYVFLGSLFLLLVVFNFLALFPHIFSLTSHLLVTLPLSYVF